MIPITLTCADYARVMPLATGEVKPEGIALTHDPGQPRLVAGARRDAPPRRAGPRAVQGGEWSMAQYLYRIDKGDRRYVGLPVFPLRNFTARDLYVRRGGPIRRPEDLAGQRIGMYSYTRQRLHLVSPLPALRGARPGRHPVVDRRHRHALVRAPMDLTLPPGVKAPPPGPVAVGHADRGRARGDLQPAAPAGLPSRDRAASPACSPTSAGSSRSTSARPARSRRST